MIRIIGTLLTLIFLSACVSNSRLNRVQSDNIVDISQNEEEYELLVLDPGFENWFITTWSPAKDRSLKYYKNWNYQYVIAWNYKATQPHTAELFNNTIQYDSNINYGMEVERKLYYYFRWVDTKLGIPILDSPPPQAL